MNEAPDADQEPAGYIRLPWPLVGGVLFLFLAALLAFGLFANRNLRPQLGVVPASTLLADATSTPPPVAAPTAVQVSTQTAATQVSTPTPLPTVVPTQAPAAALQPSA